MDMATTANFQEPDATIRDMAASEERCEYLHCYGQYCRNERRNTHDDQILQYIDESEVRITSCWGKTLALALATIWADDALAH